MKKTIVMGLFVMALSLTGCFNKDQATSVAPVTEPETTPVDEQTTDEEMNLSLSEWFELGEAVKCIVSTPTGDVGTWISGNKVRMEGVGFDPSQPMETGHMLSDGEWVYTWTGLTGMKFNVAEMANQATGGATSSQTTDWKETVATWENTGAEYSCEKIELSDGFFEMPEGVEFNDLGALLDVASSTTEGLMNNVPGNTEDVEAALEAAGITPVADNGLDAEETTE